MGESDDNSGDDIPGSIKQNDINENCSVYNGLLKELSKLLE